MLDLELLNKIIKKDKDKFIEKGETVVYIPMAVKVTKEGYIGMTICTNSNIMAEYNKEISKRKYNL